MANQITIASVQMYVHQEQKKNLIQIEKHLKHIKNIFPDISMVVFPELAVHGVVEDSVKTSVEIPGELTTIFSDLAKSHGLWLIPGSIYEWSKNDVFNTTPIFSPDGEMVGRYRKRLSLIHI